jgi:hypothetical protein
MFCTVKGEGPSSLQRPAIHMKDEAKVFLINRIENVHIYTQ